MLSSLAPFRDPFERKEASSSRANVRRIVVGSPRAAEPAALEPCNELFPGFFLDAAFKNGLEATQRLGATLP